MPEKARRNLASFSPWQRATNTPYREQWMLNFDDKRYNVITTSVFAILEWKVLFFTFITICFVCNLILIQFGICFVCILQFAYFAIVSTLDIFCCNILSLFLTLQKLLFFAKKIKCLKKKINSYNDL